MSALNTLKYGRRSNKIQEVRITLRINGPQPQRSLKSGEKNVDLGLFHAGSIRHGLVHSNL